MPRTYPTIDGGESSCFITPKGGTISLTGDPPRVAGLERITTTPTGVSFGPLKVSTPSLADTEHTVAAIENLRFAPTKGHDPDDSESDWLPSWGDDDGNETNTTTSGLLGLSLGGAAAEADDTQLTRRQTIGVMAGALALGTTTASAQSESDQIKFAEFDLVRSDGPVHVGVLPIVDNALPPDTKLTLTVDGAKRRSWTPADALESASKPNGETITLDGSQRARVEVYAKGGVGTVDELTAWAKGVLAAEREIKATLELGAKPDQHGRRGGGPDRRPSGLRGGRRSRRWLGVHRHDRRGINPAQGRTAGPRSRPLRGQRGVARVRRRAGPTGGYARSTPVAGRTDRIAN